MTFICKEFNSKQIDKQCKSYQASFDRATMELKNNHWEMNSMKAKKPLIGLFLLILLIVGTASSCAVKKIDPYTMTAPEAIVWLKENNIAIPPEINNPQIGELVIEVAKNHKAGVDMSLSISYEVTAKFIQEIQKHLE